MKRPSTRTLLKDLNRLRTDLVELAFSLEEKGRLEAADVAIAVSARVGELCEAPGEFQRNGDRPLLSPQPNEQQRADAQAKRDR